MKSVLLLHVVGARHNSKLMATTAKIHCNDHTHTPSSRFESPNTNHSSQNTPHVPAHHTEIHVTATFHSPITTHTLLDGVRKHHLYCTTMHRKTGAKSYCASIIPEGKEIWVRQVSSKGRADDTFRRNQSNVGSRKGNQQRKTGQLESAAAARTHGTY